METTRYVRQRWFLIGVATGLIGGLLLEIIISLYFL